MFMRQVVEPRMHANGKSNSQLTINFMKDCII